MYCMAGSDQVRASGQVGSACSEWVGEYVYNNGILIARNSLVATHLHTSHLAVCVCVCVMQCGAWQPQLECPY